MVIKLSNYVRQPQQRTTMCTKTMSTNISQDEQIARDIQLAIQLEAEEERHVSDNRRQHHPRSSASRLQTNPDHGYCSAAMMNNNANHMLYVPCEIDGRHQALFVDSGASSSAISSTMMRQLGLEHKLNKAFSGSARGVGSAKMLGVLENVSITIGHVEFRLFFMVLESPTPYLILGLDQMRRFKCMIDLDSNRLTFGGKDGVSVNFLSPELAADAAAHTFMATSSPSTTTTTTSYPSPSTTNNDNDSAPRSNVKSRGILKAFSFRGRR